MKTQFSKKYIIALLHLILLNTIPGLNLGGEVYAQYRVEPIVITAPHPNYDATSISFIGLISSIINGPRGGYVNTDGNNTGGGGNNTGNGNNNDDNNSDEARFYLFNLCDNIEFFVTADGHTANITGVRLYCGKYEKYDAYGDIEH